MPHKYFDLKEKGHRLCLEIDKLPASEQQTKISLMASCLNKLLGCSSPGCGYPDGKPCLQCGLIVDKQDDLRAELSTLRKELEAAKKAQEWLDKYGSDILSLAGDYIDWFTLDETSKYSIARNELRELLNNGKDGK